MRQAIKYIYITLSLMYNCWYTNELGESYTMTKKENSTAFKPQSIIEAKMTMPKAGYDIIDIVLAKMNTMEDDESNLIYEIKVADYANLLGLKHGKNAYRKMAQACETMQGKGFEIYRDANGRKKRFYVWFPMIDYDEDRQSVVLELHRDTKKMLLDAKQNNESLTYYGLRYVLPMKSQYSKRIYYMCKEWTSTGKRFDTIDDFRAKLEIPKSYKYGMIKKSILDKSVEEINNTSDIEISYSETFEKGRGGAKVVGLTWTVKEKNKDHKSDKKKVVKTNNSFNAFEKTDYNMEEIEKMVLNT